ncbi:hypothetical protein DV454_004178 [Geotrichum candidum]|uniref:Uncharacterized protein n=1 Tax=Geotrichum candidum TaxID=1173061 RepID=A0A0J9YHE9_GEOCN|nr:hypothetical protein DV454_004178 [Geotrichum candidum]CDO51258.1 hypothetical protein, no similarity [Geotrichum candidum]
MSIPKSPPELPPISIPPAFLFTRSPSSRRASRKLSRSIAGVSLPPTTEEEIPSMPLQPPKVEARQFRDQHVQAALKQLSSSKSLAEVLESGFLTPDTTNDDETAPLADETEKPARFMTLKFTLTSLETREPESIIYSGMNMVLGDAGVGASDSHDHDDTNSNREFSIPAGGFGAEPVSAKKLIIRKVFKKLNGGANSGGNLGLLGNGGSSGPGVMITSSDFADKK